MIEGIKNFFKEDNSYKLTKRLALVILVTCILSYHKTIIHYYTSPDGLIEGMSYFHNANWSLQGAGRWLVRYTMLPFGNLVIPLFVVIEYSLCILISTLMLKKLWDIKDNKLIYIIGIILSVTPTTIFLMTYMYTGMCIGLTVLLGISFTFFSFYIKGKLGRILSVFSIVLLLGIDQGFVGVAALTTLITLIIKLVKGSNIKQVLIDSGVCIVEAIIGGLIYFLILNVSLKIRNLDMIDNYRLAGFSFAKTIESFIPKFIETYKTFFNYFNDAVFKRNYVYCLLLLITIICLIVNIIKLSKEKRYGNIVLIILLFLLIPPVAFVIEIIVPYYQVYMSMEYHTCIVVVLTIYLVYISNIKVIKIITSIIVILLSWSYVLSANATYKAYELSYNHINSEMQLILNDIYHTEGYKKDEAPIILAGFPDDKVLRENDKTYYYAIDFPKNPVFWEDMNGATVVRKNYFMYYFGVDAKDITVDEYYKTVTSKEFKEMNVWPNSNSVKMINGYCVVKLTDNPILPY